MTWTEPTLIDENCLGVQTWAIGSVTATGKSNGYVTGDPMQPIVPDSWTPAEVQMELNLIMLYLTTNVDRKFTIASGKVSGTIMPRTEMDGELGVCALKIPTVKFMDIQMEDMDAIIENEGVNLSAFISEGLLNAQSGKHENLENWLTGQLVIDDEAINLPLEVAHLQSITTQQRITMHLVVNPILKWFRPVKTVIFPRGWPKTHPAYSFKPWVILPQW